MSTLPAGSLGKRWIRHSTSVSTAALVLMVPVTGLASTPTFVALGLLRSAQPTSERECSARPRLATMFWLPT